MVAGMDLESMSVGIAGSGAVGPTMAPSGIAEHVDVPMGASRSPRLAPS